MRFWAKELIFSGRNADMSRLFTKFVVGKTCITREKEITAIYGYRQKKENNT
jgi:hypothetical protein